MNKSNSASKIKMKSFDDLFGTNENLEQANANGGEIREIPLASLHQKHSRMWWKHFGQRRERCSTSWMDVMRRALNPW